MEEEDSEGKIKNIYQSFANNELIVGVPAKSVATNIEWCVERI